MDDSNSSRRKRSLDANDDADGKKQRNRESARKCRERKVKQTETLKKENDKLVKTNKELNDKKADLERKLKNCIQEIMRHKQSGCVLPENVANIIDSTGDFLAVGVRVTRRQHCDPNNPDLVNLDSDMECDVPVEEPRTTMKGLFNGENLPEIDVRRSKMTNSPSRSSSKSPPVSSALSGNNVARPSSSLSSLSSCSVHVNDCTSPQWTQSSWALLHQQTLNGQTSPGLSPLQTVPNIDPDWENSVSNYSNKQNGFPDIDEAIETAQRDPGVVEDAGYNHLLSDHLQYESIESPCCPGVERRSLQSLGFIPTITPTLPSASNAPNSSHFSANLVNSNNQFVSHSLTVFPDSLKPTTSTSSTTVSMNNTAELLSQAMTCNFDASEISEDLKKQYAQLAKSDDDEVQQHPNQGIDVPTEQNNEIPNGTVQYQDMNMTQTQATSENVNEISYDNLLRLAKENQFITVQYQGREYPCNYLQVEQLIKYISGQKSAANSDVNGNEQIETYYAQSPVLQEVDTNGLLDQANNNSFTSHNQIFSPLNNLSLNDSIVSNDSIVQSALPTTVVERVQSTHLPTTVLSMIEEDSQQSQSQSVTVSHNDNFNTESVDYSHNLKDLPSLSLQEDHSNIFEKKRRST